MAHRASTEAFHFCLSTATPRTSSHEPHPPSFISLSTVLLHVVFGLPLFLFPSVSNLTPSLYRSLCPALECGQWTSIFSLLPESLVTFPPWLVTLWWWCDLANVCCESSGGICFETRWERVHRSWSFSRSDIHTSRQARRGSCTIPFSFSLRCSWSSRS